MKTVQRGRIFRYPFYTDGSLDLTMLVAHVVGVEREVGVRGRKCCSREGPRRIYTCDSSAPFPILESSSVYI